MKKMLRLASILVISVALVACGNNDSSATERDSNTNKHLNGVAEQSKGESMADTRVKLMFSNKEVFVRMYDNPASRDFLAQLPLTITFEDY
ncbi:cyclophilin-like fold protein, partial [Priestia megaterium]